MLSLGTGGILRSTSSPKIQYFVSTYIYISTDPDDGLKMQNT